MIEFSNDEIIRMGLPELWEVLNLVMEEEAEDKRPLKEHYRKEIEEIKEGIKVKFPIHKIINKFVEHYPQSNTVRIKGLGKIRDILYNEEVDERKLKIRKILIDIMEDGDSGTKPRN